MRLQDYGDTISCTFFRHRSPCGRLGVESAGGATTSAGGGRRREFERDEAVALRQGRGAPID